MERAWVTEYDEAIHEVIRHAKQVPVLINYSFGKRRNEKSPDAFDTALLDAINKQPIPYWFPTDRMPEGYNTKQPKESHGITHVHQFYTKRHLITLSALMNNVKNFTVSSFLQFAFEQAIFGFSKLNRYVPTHYSQSNRYLAGTLYIGSQRSEVSPGYLLQGKIHRLVKSLNTGHLRQKNNSSILTTSSTSIMMPSQRMDYMFLDPPFGSNIMYSELNFLWEAWLKVFTNNGPEAIVNSVQKKTLADYQRLMEESFQAAYRMLKPGRWMTVEFSNTQTAVWNAITQALQQAGFVIANVSALDKKQGSFKAVTTTTAVKQDLVISAYKPSEAMTRQVADHVGHRDGMWAFVDEHLRHLPVFMGKKGKAEIIEERQPRNIYDRLVAYYVSRGWPLPILTSGDFQSELIARYPLRDTMVFMEDQVAAYDQKKMLVKELLQAELFVSNESTAIEWIRQRLLLKPQAYHDLQPDFMKSIQHIDKYEKLPELIVLLEQNFLKYDQEYGMPEQILRYLRANYHNFRGNEITLEMRQKAKGFWYVPDPRKAADLDKLRERDLWREFEQYLQDAQNSPKRLKMCRTEALKAGFKKLWTEQRYQEIVSVGNKLPPVIVQENIAISQFVNNAQSLLG